MDKLFRNLTFREIGTALLDLAMPRCCVVCREPLLLRERFICTKCLADLPLTYFWSRSHHQMADRYNERIQASLSQARPDSRPSPDHLLPQDSSSSSSESTTDALPHQLSPSGGLRDINQQREPYAYAAALFFYNSESDYRHIPRHLKYQAGLASGRYFAAMLGRALASEPLFADVDVVIPVPLHWTRQCKRGYNQAEVIARELTSALGAECRTDWLRRVRRTATQTRVSVAAKSANVTGAFRASPALIRFASLCSRHCDSSGSQTDSYPGSRPGLGFAPGGPSGPSSPSPDCRPGSRPGLGFAPGVPSSSRAGRCYAPGELEAWPRHVLLVDDTFTTGATLNACRAALRTVLPPSVRISVATLAYVST